MAKKDMKTKLLLVLGLLLGGCQFKAPDSASALIARNRQLGERYFNQVWNQGKVELLDSLLAPNYINHTPSAPTSPGPAGLKPIVKAIRKAFPDLHYEIKQLIATPEYLTIRVEMTGTQLGSLFGIPPTGKPIRVMQINIEKIENGRISQHWRVTDELGMFKQLGLVP